MISVGVLAVHASYLIFIAIPAIQHFSGAWLLDGNYLHAFSNN